jgi:hypothetical protein
MERNAVLNLEKLLPFLNTEGNEYTPKEHYLLLRPTRIGPSDSWALRKPVSIVFSLLMGAYSVFSLVANGSFTLGSLLSSSIGVFSIPFMHYGFAFMGWINTKRDIKRFHQRINYLEKKWSFILSRGEENPGFPQGPKKTFAPDKETPEEDFIENPVEVAREDAEALYSLADSLRVIPVNLTRQMESLCVPGESSGLFLLVIPESLMLTRDCRKIDHPVRLGNKILVGDEYYRRHRGDPTSFFKVSGERKDDPEAVPGSTEDSGKDVSGAIPGRGVPALSSVDAPGGIDFRSIAFAVRPAGAGFEEEFIQTQKLLNAGIIPNGERLKGCLDKIPAAERKGCRERVNNILAEIFMLEERYARGSNPVFSAILKEWVAEAAVAR